MNRIGITLTLAIVLAATVVGCGRPLQRLETRAGCPWSGPKQQVQVGRRSMGHSFYGEIWKEFWVDESGREYDPEEVSKKVWKYIETTNLAKSIRLAGNKHGCAQMQIVALNPTIVLLYPSEYQRLKGVGENLSKGTRMAQELAYQPLNNPIFAEPMEWLSPDLATGPQQLKFSANGEAEIPLKSGRIKLVHSGDHCLVTRE